MARRGRSNAVAVSICAISATLAAYKAGQLFVPFVGSTSPRSQAAVVGGYDLSRRIVLRADAKDAEVVRSSALMKVEDEIEAKIKLAEEAGDQTKITELARLLVLTKASEGAAAWQETEELRGVVGDSIAATLEEFVGKENYDIKDVAAAVDAKVGTAVSSMNNVYLTAEAAKNAPEGSNPVILTDVMAPVVDEMAMGAEEAALAFTGKEEYKFGDISKEANARAQKAIANVLGKEEYKFGDISKAAANKMMEGVASFTGKEKYQFGDITKTALKGALSWLEGDDKDKK